MKARIFRISFTGELSYEINVPSRYGLAVWQRSYALDKVRHHSLWH